MPTDNVDRLVQRVHRKTRRAVADAFESAIADRRARPTIRECMDSAAAMGGDLIATAAAWGYCQSSRDGAWLDVLKDTDDANEIGLVPNMQAMLELTAFSEHFGFNPPFPIKIGKWPAVSTARHSSVPQRAVDCSVFASPGTR